MNVPPEEMDGVITTTAQPPVPCAVCGHQIQFADQAMLEHVQHLQQGEWTVASPVTTAVPIQPLSGALVGPPVLVRPAYTTSATPQFGQQSRSSWRLHWEQFFPAMLRSCDYREAWDLLQSGISQLSSTVPQLREPSPSSSRQSNPEPEYYRDRYYQLKDHQKYLDQQLLEQQRIYHEYRQQSDLRVKEATETAQNLRTTVDKLRAQVFAIGSSRAPRNDGDFYNRKFNTLNTALDQGVLKLAREGKQDLSDSALKEITESIALLGDSGPTSARFLNDSAYNIRAL